jgi:hypothetical protein
MFNLKEWRLKNKEKIALKNKQYALEHPDIIKKAQRNWNKRNVQKKRDSGKKWRDANPDFVRNHHLKQSYGITLEQYNQMFKNQNGVCAICGNPETKIDKQLNKLRVLSVDHNHTTGQIRGLLCDRCNLGIAFFKDNAEILNRASKYLNKGRIIQNTETGK